MYEAIKTVIQGGGYDLSALLAKIDILWVQGSLTDDQRAELRTKAQEGAAVKNSVDVMKKLLELDTRVTALEAAGGSDTAVEEFQAGKWYYNGARVSWEGATYVCTAPEGVACVWSPADYPAYWTQEE